MTSKRTIEERVERARQLHRQGYNCAQSTILAFDDLDSSADWSQLTAAACALGGGVGGMRQICGVVTGMGLVQSMLMWKCPADKKSVYGSVSGLGRRYADINGSMICGELLATRKKSCADLVADGVRILAGQLGITE